MQYKQGNAVVGGTNQAGGMDQLVTPWILASFTNQVSDFILNGYTDWPNYIMRLAGSKGPSWVMYLKNDSIGMVGE